MAMPSQGAATRPHHRRRGRDATTSNISMDLDSIRTRRARLQALTASIRLPPLTPVDALVTRPSSVYNKTSHRSLPSGERFLRLRQNANLPTSAASVREQSENTKLPALSLPPMTPYHNPLPEIGQAREQVEQKTEDKNHLNDTRIESPPPPTYEESQNVFRWVEETSQEVRVETLPPLKSPDNQKPSRPASTTEEDEEAAEREKSDFAKIVSDMGSNDLQTQLDATLMARKLLSEISQPPIDEFLHADILTPALDNLEKENNVLLFETVWVITNIASGCSSQTKALVDRGFIEPLVKLLNSNKANVQEQVTWALGNIAGDGSELRNIVVAGGIIKPLVALITKDITLSFLRNITWTFSNLFRTKNLEMPDDEKTLVLRVMKENLLPHDDREVNVDALWTVEYYTNMGNDYIQQVVDAGIIPLLIKHLHSHEVRVLSPALRTVGNIVSGTDAQTDAVLEADILPIFLHLLTNRKTDIRKHSAWGLSNILAGTPSQIQMVIDAGIIPALVERAQEDEFNVRKEVIWGLVNMVEEGSKEQIEVLVSSGGLQQLVTNVSILDTNVKVLATKGIIRILKTLDGDDSVKDAIMECGGLGIIKDNLYHENSEVSGNITEILNYFQDLREENDTMSPEKEQVLPEKASKYVADLTKE